ncbi:MAG: ribonuclease H family protein [Muribaculaceae bacterium]|nr:ribonuclease H family protein [Muribaculaceae bacterium]
MAPVKRKYYVVWAGHSPGIYDSWVEAQEQISGYAGARYKAFADLEEATEAYRGDPSEYMGLYRALGQRAVKIDNYESIPGIRLDAIAVDAACSHNPGPVEYRGVMVGSGKQIFHVGPLQGGSNNIGEYLALIHAAALLSKNGDTMTPIYSDSRTALSWFRNRHSKTKVIPTPENRPIMELLERADRWVASHHVPNPILKWDTDQWGEIPADFGRK